MSRSRGVPTSLTSFEFSNAGQTRAEPIIPDPIIAIFFIASISLQLSYFLFLSAPQKHPPICSFWYSSRKSEDLTLRCFPSRVFLHACCAFCVFCVFCVTGHACCFKIRFCKHINFFPIIQLISQNYFSAQILIEAQRKAKGVFAFPQLDPKTCRASLLKSLETFWNHRKPLGPLGIMGSLLAQRALKSQTMV